MTDPIEKVLIEQDNIAQQAGNGNIHLVYISIHTDTFDGLRELSDPEIREAAGILKTNVFLFHIQRTLKNGYLTTN